MNIIFRLLKTFTPKREKKKLTVKELKHCFLTGYCNKDISMTLKKVKLFNGVVSDVRVNGRWVLFTSHFLHTHVGYKSMKPNSFIIIEYNIRFPSNSGTIAFKRTKHDMGIITRSYVTFNRTLPFGEKWSGKIDLDSYVQRVILEDLEGDILC